MTSLFMGHLFNEGVPADERVVRNQATPVNDDKPPAMAPDAPEQGEFRSDQDPELGMHMRNLASEWVEGTTVDTGARRDPISQINAAQRIINDQVSSSGTAAAREAAGVGHDTLSYAVGIEPVQDLRSNGKFGETYFVRTDRRIQETSTPYMTPPPGYDIAASTRAATLGKETAKEASTGSIYDQFWNGGK